MPKDQASTEDVIYSTDSIDSSTIETVASDSVDEDTDKLRTKANTLDEATLNQLIDLVPKEYLFKDVATSADFDGDGETDHFIIVQGTKKYRYESCQCDEDTLVNKNPRGYLLAMKRGDQFVVTSYNYGCFPSDHEDGGVYFAPELYVEYETNTRQLNIEYDHGRYGSWGYSFKYKDGDFVLVGKRRDESMSWTTETLYWEYENYETGRKKYSRITNPDALDTEDPIYDKGEEDIVDKPDCMILSEGKKWH